MVLPKINPTKSYWIEAAESPLRNFRSSEQLPEETDVVIIGSGYAGAATAYWIHKVRTQIILTNQRSVSDTSSVYRESVEATYNNPSRSTGYLWICYGTKW